MTSRTYSASLDRSAATETLRQSLAESFVGMAAEITRPRSIRWKLDDAARGRPCNPLGSYPIVAEECLEAGASFHSVTRPLTVMLAHLRRRCTGKLSDDMKPAILNLKKECDDAEATALTLAFPGNLSDASALSAFDKEADEAIIALEKARELAEDRLVALTEGK